MFASTRRPPLATIALAALLLGVAAWVFLGPPPLEPPPEIGGYVLAEPRALPHVVLVDEHDARFETASFAGRWSFLYFGYTYCPDVCPLALLMLANLKQQLAVDLPAIEINFYLVSMDPQRDTPARLREYVAYFDPGFRGLTGTADALAELAKATETLFVVPEGEDSDQYLVSHSSNVVLLNPNGDVHAVFTPPHDPARLAADFTKVVSHHSALP